MSTYTKTDSRLIDKLEDTARSAFQGEVVDLLDRAPEQRQEHSRRIAALSILLEALSGGRHTSSPDPWSVVLEHYNRRAASSEGLHPLVDLAISDLTDPTRWIDPWLEHALGSLGHRYFSQPVRITAEFLKEVILDLLGEKERHAMRRAQVANEEYMEERSQVVAVLEDHARALSAVVDEIASMDGESISMRFSLPIVTTLEEVMPTFCSPRTLAWIDRLRSDWGTSKTCAEHLLSMLAEDARNESPAVHRHRLDSVDARHRDFKAIQDLAEGFIRGRLAFAIHPQPEWLLELDRPYNDHVLKTIADNHLALVRLERAVSELDPDDPSLAIAFDASCFDNPFATEFAISLDTVCWLEHLGTGWGDPEDLARELFRLISRDISAEIGRLNDPIDLARNYGMSQNEVAAVFEQVGGVVFNGELCLHDAHLEEALALAAKARDQ